MAWGGENGCSLGLRPDMPRLDSRHPAHVLGYFAFAFPRLKFPPNSLRSYDILLSSPFHFLVVFIDIFVFPLTLVVAFHWVFAFLRRPQNSIDAFNDF